MKKFSNDTKFFAATAICLVLMIVGLVMVASTLLDISDKHHAEAQQATQSQQVEASADYDASTNYDAVINNEGAPNDVQQAWATIYDITPEEGCVTFVTEDGNLWAWYTDDVEQYNSDYFYLLMFDNNTTVEERCILKVFQEVC